MRIVRIFTEHPDSVGETYGQHFVVAMGFGVRMIGAGIACLVHACLPFLFVRTGSTNVARLHEVMSARAQLAQRNAAAAAQEAVESRGAPPA
jgi:hypothetical protein